MAISAEAHTALDALAVLKDDALTQVTSFNNRYQSIASDLAQDGAAALLAELDTDYQAWRTQANTDIVAARNQVKTLISAATPEDATDITAAYTEINSVIDNLSVSTTELRDNMKTAKVEIAKLTAEATKPSSDSAPTNNTKAPAGADDEKGVVAKSAPSTTTAGKAGQSKANAAPKVGLRDYNPLSEFSSYTYRIALYMMNTVQFNKYMTGDYSALKEFQLIAQSGGITSGLDSPRAEGFELDLYLDDLEITTLINSKETQAATNSINFKFKVYEPYGFSFPHKLTKAMIASQKRNAKATNTTLEQIQSLNESFLMVVKFYGYDKDGKIVSSTDYSQPNVIKTDSQSVFERGFPIRFKEFKFKLENKVTVYSISAVQYAEQIAKGANLGTVPAKISLSGETVKDVLIGKSQDSGKKSIIGLAEMLNKMEEDELNKKNPAIKFKNVYKIEFAENTGIDDSLLVPKDYYVKEKAPMSTVEGGVANSNERTAWQKRLGTVEKKTRTVEIPAGQPIVQAIDNIIGQSEYLKKMMVAVDKEIDESVKDTDSSTDVNSQPATLSWYNINPVVTRTFDDWDEKRGDYAHEITYVISKYEIPYIRSLYASNTMSYYGPHKRYHYWYTGQNTEVLSYEQDYNFLYTLEGSMASDAETKNLQSAKTKLKAAIGGADATTAKSGKNDIINSVKSFLYSPGDLINFKLKVLGDPDYLMPSIGTSDNNSENKWYGKDLSINPNSGQVFFEILFQQAEDYSNETGLLVPNDDITIAAYPDSMKVKPKGIVYMLTQVTSHFSKGKFEQTLKGVVPEFVNAGATDGRDSTPPAATSNPRQTTNPVLDSSGRQTAASDPRIAGNQTVEATPTPAPENGVASDDNPGTSGSTSGSSVPVEGRPRGGA